MICKAEQGNTPNCSREIRDVAAILQVKGSCFSAFEPSPGVIRVTSLVPNAGTMTDRKNVTIYQNSEYCYPHLLTLTRRLHRSSGWSLKSRHTSTTAAPTVLGFSVLPPLAATCVPTGTMLSFTIMTLAGQRESPP